jgi:hypothetical protein
VRLSWGRTSPAKAKEQQFPAAAGYSTGGGGGAGAGVAGAGGGGAYGPYAQYQVGIVCVVVAEAVLTGGCPCVRVYVCVSLAWQYAYPPYSGAGSYPAPYHPQYPPPPPHMYATPPPHPMAYHYATPAYPPAPHYAYHPPMDMQHPMASPPYNPPHMPHAPGTPLSLGTAHVEVSGCRGRLLTFVAVCVCVCLCVVLCAAVDEQSYTQQGAGSSQYYNRSVPDAARGSRSSRDSSSSGHYHNKGAVKSLTTRLEQLDIGGGGGSSNSNSKVRLPTPPLLSPAPDPCMPCVCVDAPTRQGAYRGAGSYSGGGGSGSGAGGTQRGGSPAGGSSAGVSSQHR